LEAAIQDLMTKREALEKAYESQTGLDLRGAISAIVQVGKDFGETYSAISTSDWLQAGQSFYRGSQEFGGLLTLNRVPPNAPDYYTIDQAMKQARASLDDFDETVRHNKREMFESQMQSLRDLVAARDRLEQYRTTKRLEYFLQQIEASLQEYVQTSDMHVLEENVQFIKSSFDEINVPHDLELSSILNRNLCEGNTTPAEFPNVVGNVGCVEFKREQHPYAIMSTGGVLDGFPLLIVPPDTKYTRSFENAFTANQLTKRDISDQFGWQDQ
jgi:hypothetical protein